MFDANSRFLIGQYFPGKSFFHLSHPVFKILLLFLHCILVFRLSSLAVVFFLLGFTLFSFYICKIRLLMVLRGMKPVFFLLLITLILHIFSHEGTILYELGPLRATREGFSSGIFYCLRLILVILASSLLTITTSSNQIAHATEKILKPLQKLRFPVQEFSLMMAISLRFIPVLLEELEKLILCQRARGACFHKGSLKNRITLASALLIPLFNSALQRADQLAIAMELRGFDPGEKRTSIHQHKISKADFLLLLSWSLAWYLSLYA